MYLANKVIWALTNPTMLGFAGVVLGLFFSRHCWGRRILVVSFVGMWIWAMPATTRILGLPLEREWLIEGKVPRVESFPVADAIVLLGGSMGGSSNVSDYAEMSQCADRVWQAARLWKDQEGRRNAREGNARVRIFVSGKGSEWTTKGLLVDFGVPTDVLTFVDKARNTEEEAREIARLFDGSDCLIKRGHPKVLLVTSAWHMRRAKMMFEKYASGLDVVPAPTDFETAMRFPEGFSWLELLPSGQCMAANEYLLHEWLGCWGYKIFR